MFVRTLQRIYEQLLKFTMHFIVAKDFQNKIYVQFSFFHQLYFPDCSSPHDNALSLQLTFYINLKILHLVLFS